MVAVLLLFSGIVLSVAAYAWVTLSISPSVEGMSVNIGANGGLELALLSDVTYRNTDLIRTSVGDSSEIRPIEEANLSWGNILDLSSEAYGLNRIRLLPTTLIVHTSGSGAPHVEDGLLRIPSFGFDGRINSMEENALSGTYENGAFLCSTGGEPHGVRAIGTTEETSVQQRAMILARGGISVNRTMARQAAENALRENGSVLFNLPARHALSPEALFGAEDGAALGELAAAAGTALGYLDTALRNSAIAVAASQLREEDRFDSVYALLRDEDTPLDRTLASLPMSLSETLGHWAGLLEGYRREVAAAKAACEALTGGTYTWEEISPILAHFVDPAQVYYGEEPYSPEKPLSAGGRLTLMPGSGVFSGIADFTRAYSVSAMHWEGLPDNRDLELRAMSASSPPWLDSLTLLAANLEAAGDDTLRFPLDDVYGYAIDMAFRTNADRAELLLQTEALQRIYGDAALPGTQGGGSYVVMYSSGLEYKRLVQLMDALRVSFVDGSGTLLAMAKLNTSNIEPYDEGYRAPLYLYEYSLQEDSVVMGERRDAPGRIASLPRNTPYIVTAIVWLDGQSVGNSLAAYYGSSLTGSLNLQFSEDRTLYPAEDGAKHDTEWAMADAGEHIRGRIRSLGELPEADSVEWIELYSNEAEARTAGAELPESCYLVVRDGLPCFRVYPEEENAGIVMTGYDGETLFLPPDSSGLFAGLEALAEIRNPEKLRLSSAVRSDRLFDGCSSLPSVDGLLSGLTHIGDYAFSGCVSLNSVTIPESVAGVGTGVFSGCSGLTRILVPRGADISEDAFVGCDAAIEFY